MADRTRIWNLAPSSGLLVTVIVPPVRFHDLLHEGESQAPHDFVPKSRQMTIMRNRLNRNGNKP